MTPEQLEEVFGNEKNYNVTSFEDSGSEFPDGTAWAFCTNWAHYVRRVLGARCEIYGFDEEQNPDSLIAQEAGGHDFALVDGRYIVDGWAKNVEGMANRAVFDLEDEAQTDEILRLYGHRENWGRGDGNENAIDAESAIEREKAMAGTMFQPVEATPAPGI